jgi:hypothetical protein
LLNGPFGLLVAALAELVMANASLRVDEVERGPILIAECIPDREVVVDRNRIRNPHVFDCPPDVVQIMLERELGRMHADHHQPLILVFIGPCANVRKRAQPIDAGVRPHVEQDDLSAQIVGRQRAGIEPSGGTAERRQRAFHREFHHRRSALQCDARLLGQGLDRRRHRTGDYRGDP